MSRDIDRDTADRVARNLAAMGDFLTAVLDDASLLDEIPAETTVMLAPDDDPVTAHENEQFAAKARRAGRPVHLIRFARSSPKRHRTHAPS